MTTYPRWVRIEPDGSTTPVEEVRDADCRRIGFRDETGRFDPWTPTPPDHPQVALEAPDWHRGPTVEVDAGLAPLLAALWRENFITVMSCQDSGGGQASVLFACASMAQRFAWLVTGERRPAGWDVEEFDLPHEVWPRVWANEPLWGVRFPAGLLPAAAKAVEARALPPSRG